MMLLTITEITDEIVRLLRDDPVRPEIPVLDRINGNSRVYMLKQDDQAQAVTCVKFLDAVPATVQDLDGAPTRANTAVFYTIWSYKPGAGRDLIIMATQSIETEFPHITTYVTLSPKTEMARRFHLRNGARELRENLDTINYIYK